MYVLFSLVILLGSLPTVCQASANEPVDVVVDSTGAASALLRKEKPLAVNLRDAPAIEPESSGNARHNGTGSLLEARRNAQDVHVKALAKDSAGQAPDEPAEDLPEEAPLAREELAEEGEQEDAAGDEGDEGEGGDEEEGDLLENQQQLIDKLKELIEYVKGPVLNEVTRLREEAKAARAKEDEKRKAHKVDVEKLKDVVLEVKQHLQTTQQKAILKTKEVEKAIDAVKQVVLENRELTANAATQAAIDNTNLGNNMEKMKVDVTAIRTEVFENRAGHNHSAAKARADNIALGNKVSTMKTKLLDGTTGITDNVAAIERDVEVNGKEAKMYAQAAQTANANIGNALKEQAANVGQKLSLAIASLQGIEAAVKEHASEVKSEQARVDHSHSTLSNQIQSTQDDVQHRMKGVGNEVDNLDSTIEEERKKVVSASKHSKEQTARVEGDIQHLQSDLSNCKKGIRQVDQAIEDGHKKDEELQRQVAKDIDAKKQTLLEHSSKLGSAISDAKKTVDEGRTTQQNRQGAAINGDAKFSSKLRKVRAVLEKLGVETQIGLPSDRLKDYRGYYFFDGE